MGRYQYLCGRCLRDWGFDADAAERCAKSHSIERAPTNEDR